MHRWTLNPSRLFIRFLLRCGDAVQCKRASKHSLTLLVCPIFCRPPMIAHASPRLIMASQARMSKATPYLLPLAFSLSSQSNRVVTHKNPALLAPASCVVVRSFPLHLLFSTDAVHAIHKRNRRLDWPFQNFWQSGS